MSATVTITAPSSLSDRDVGALHALHSRYFANVRIGTFHSDLAEKNWVIRLFDGDALVGFSTQQLLTLPVLGSLRRFLFSGDTVVAHTHRNQFGLAGAFGHLFLRLLEAPSTADLHWFLICKGYRTYRFLPLFFQQFLPSQDADAGADEGLKRLLDAAAIAKYGASYDAAQGLVRHAAQRDRLRAAWARRDSARRTDPLVRFFMTRNPGWRDGDELACIASLARGNLKSVAWRVIRATTPLWETEA